MYRSSAVATLLFLWWISLLFAQQPSPPQKEHVWLQKFVGEWDVVSEGSMGEGQPPVTGEAAMKSSMLGDLWVVNKSQHEVAGMKMQSIQMIGYDPDKQKFVGIWADSMINYLWHYEGTLDENGMKLTLEAEGPNMAGEGMSLYRDAYEFTDDDTIVATSSMQDGEGGWTVFMTGTAKRRK